MVARFSYAPHSLRMTQQELREFIREHADDPQYIYDIVVAVDYVYHEGDGLGLLDRINEKVPRYSQNTIENAKNQIRDQSMALLACIRQLWTVADMEYYGV